MRINGNLSVVGLLKDVKIDQLAADPGAPALSQVWFNSTDSEMKFYDGTTVQVIATGTGDLGAYLKLDGSIPMSGELELSSADQSASGTAIAVSKGHLDTELALKQDNLTGATSALVATDLTVSKAVVSDASGKIIAATSTSAAEIEYLAGVTSAIQTQLDSKEADLGYVPVNKAGDTMTGNLAMSDSRITGVGAPINPTDAARQIDIDTALLGFDFKADVLAVQTDANLDPTASPTTGDRYIITDSGNLHANFGTIAGVGDGDVVVFDGADFVVASDVSVEGEGILLWDQQLDVFMKYDGTSWTEFGGLAGVTAGIGLAKSGNTIFVNMGAGIAQLPSDEIGVECKTDGGLDVVDPSTGVQSFLTDAVVAIKLNGSSMETTASGLAIAANGVTETMINTTALGNGLQGGSGTTLSVKTVAGSGITVDGTGVLVDDVEMRTRVLYRDGAEAMTGVLVLSSDDQTGQADTTAISKGHLDAALVTAGNTVTALETRMENGYFLYEELVTASTSHTVTHSMNNKFVQVSVVDLSDEVVLPESITFTDVNSLAVTFANAETCRIIVTGLKVA